MSRVEKTSDRFFFFIQKTNVFAAIDDLKAPSLIFLGPDQAGEGREIRRRPDIAAEPFRPPTQARKQRLPRAVNVVVDAAAGPARLAAVRLAEVDERFVGHVSQGMPRSVGCRSGTDFPVRNGCGYIYEERDCRSRAKMVIKA